MRRKNCLVYIAATEGGGHERHHHPIRSAAQDAQPHGVIIDQDGMIWFSDFSHQLFAELEAVPLRQRGEAFGQQKHRLARMLDEIRMEIV